MLIASMAVLLMELVAWFRKIKIQIVLVMCVITVQQHVTLSNRMLTRMAWVIYVIQLSRLRRMLSDTV